MRFGLFKHDGGDEHNLGVCLWLVVVCLGANFVRANLRMGCEGSRQKAPRWSRPYGSPLFGLPFFSKKQEKGARTAKSAMLFISIFVALPGLPWALWRDWMRPSNKLSFFSLPTIGAVRARNGRCKGGRGAHKKGKRGCTFFMRCLFLCSIAGRSAKLLAVFPKRKKRKRNGSSRRLGLHARRLCCWQRLVVGA